MGNPGLVVQQNGKKLMDSTNIELRSTWLFAGNICLKFCLGKVGLVGELVDWLSGVGKLKTMKYLKMVWNEKLVLRNKNKKKRGHVG